MSFVVEDGSGKSNANSYVSVTNADTYHTEHGAPATWSAATTAQKQGALMVATTWLDSEFVWRGLIANDDQALGWPRSECYDAEGREIDDNIVPQKVKDATAYLGLQHLASALDATFARGGDVKRERVDVVEVEYMDRARATTWIPYARRILTGLFTGAPGAVTLQRA